MISPPTKSFQIHQGQRIAQLLLLPYHEGKKLISTAVCIKSGRTSCVYRVEIKDDLGKDVAQAMFTGFKLEQEPNRRSGSRPE